VRRALPPALLAALALAACRQPTEVDVQRAVVGRSGPSIDTVRVGRADTLALTARVTLVRGRAAWAVRDPSGAVAWRGAADDDTTARWRTARPARGAWTVEVRPDSAVGAVEVFGRAW
jgi:hypothetical protein